MNYHIALNNNGSLFGKYAPFVHETLGIQSQWRALHGLHPLFPFASLARPCCLCSLVNLATPFFVHSSFTYSLLPPSDTAKPFPCRLHGASCLSRKLSEMSSVLLDAQPPFCCTSSPFTSASSLRTLACLHLFLPLLTILTASTHSSLPMPPLKS